MLSADLGAFRELFAIVFRLANAHRQRACRACRAHGRAPGHSCRCAGRFPAVIRRKNELVQQWRLVAEKHLARAGAMLTLKRAHARFLNPHEIEIDGERHEADTLVIDAGARHAVPQIPGLDEVAWLDNASVMELNELPEHLVVLGGGYIGCELGQAFRRFGAGVTIIDRNEHLLAREDEDISQVVEDVFVREGISLRLGTDVQRVRTSGSSIEVETTHGGAICGTHLLVAARPPAQHA